VYIDVVSGNRAGMEGPLPSSRYSIVSRVGCGGMAEVYLARDTVSDNKVALKLLKEQYVDSEEFRKRFRREAESIASLSHPNIVSAYDWGKAEDGRPYIAMEYVEGGTLAKRIVTKGALDPFEAAAIARQVALALAESHRRGVIHRDIKPHNIFLTGNPLDSVGAVKVGDFGIARALEATVMTGTSMILGTVGYLSPEQARGEPMGPWSDLYSLGVVLYEMLTGRVPFDADGPIAVAMKHVSEVPCSPREVNPQVPEDLEAITLTLLSKNPALRYPGALALVEDLERVGCGLTPRYFREEVSTETLEHQALPNPRAAGRANSTGPARPRDGRASALTASRKRWRLRRRLSAAAIVGISALTLAAGGPAAGLYEIPGLPVFRSLAEGMANHPEEDQVLPVQADDHPEEDQVLPVQKEEGRYASQEESEKDKTPSESQGAVENFEDSALDSGSSVPELASVEPAPETQHVVKPTASPLSPSTQPKAKSSRGSGTSTSSTSPTRKGETKGSSPLAKNIAEQSQPKSLLQNSSQKTSGNSADLTEFSKDKADNREGAQEEREEAREQAEEQAEDAAEEKEEAREEAKERLK
jgi:eukaryotic-like serine/threonine-protein kinase